MSEEFEEPLEQEEGDLYEHYRVDVDRGQSPLRIDKFLTGRLQNISRNRIQHAADAGSIRVNGKSVKSNYKVKPEDAISIVLAYPPRDTEVYPENIPLEIVFEDEDIIVVNKPAGMVVHPGYNNYQGTLVNALLYHVGMRSMNGQVLPAAEGNELRPGLVHRIDKDTSGLLLAAKHERALNFLAKQFFDHTIERKYLALIWGDVEEEGEISGYLGRSVRDRKLMHLYEDEEKGKWSLTRYRLLERFHFVSLVECRLETGRTHQIRAHMKHIGHPLFGDAGYGGDIILKGGEWPKYKQFIKNCFDLMPRQALHAKSLGFIHPRTREPLHFETALPGDFQTVLDRWRNYTSANNS